jgi:hypothetical protein
MLEFSLSTGAGSMAALAKLETPTAKTVLKTNALIMMRSFLALRGNPVITRWTR